MILQDDKDYFPYFISNTSVCNLQLNFVYAINWVIKGHDQFGLYEHAVKPTPFIGQKNFYILSNVTFEINQITMSDSDSSAAWV